MTTKNANLNEIFKGIILFKGMVIIIALSIIVSILQKNYISGIVMLILSLSSRIIVNIAWKKAFNPLLFLISNMTQFGTYYVFFMMTPLLWKPLLSYNIYWYVPMLIIGGLSVILFALLENIIWPKRVKEWEKIGKMNIVKGQFNILAPWRDITNKDIKTINLSYYVIPIIIAVYVLLSKSMANGIQIIIFRIVSMGIILGFGAVVGQYIIWVIKIHKLQREGANLKTEYSRILQNS